MGNNAPAKGSKENPYSLSEYEKMLKEGTWPGGYVDMGDPEGPVYALKEVVVIGYSSGVSSGSYEFASYKSFQGDPSQNKDDNGNDYGGGHRGGGYSGGDYGSGSTGSGGGSGSGYNYNITISRPNVSSTTPTGSLAAALAGYAYKADDIQIYADYIKDSGWRVADQDLKDSLTELCGMIFEHYNGYKTQLFVKYDADNSIAGYVLAFAGTDLAFNDAGNDIVNFLGSCAAQYEMALNMAYKLHAYAGSTEVTFIGHSLGGGLAALASMNTGRVAITFNAASVANTWKETLISLHCYSGTGNIWNYVTEDDWLTPLQDNLGIPSDGTRIYVPRNSTYGGHAILKLMRLLICYQ